MTDDDVAGIKAKTTHDERVAYMINELEEPHFGSERVCEIDKAWDGIHRAFDDESDLDFDGSKPLELAVLGGEPRHSEADYILILKTPEQARTAATALGGVDEATFRKLYFAIDPAKYDGEIDEDEFGYHWDWLQLVKQFYQRAAATGRSVLFSVDQ